ncbi:MAG: hypothetical protein ACK559_41400 [bacterium]
MELVRETQDNPGGRNVDRCGVGAENAALEDAVEVTRAVQLRLENHSHGPIFTGGEVERLELRLAVDLPLRRVCRHGCAKPGYK